MRILFAFITLSLPFYSCNSDITASKKKKKIGNYFIEAYFIKDSICDGIASYYDDSGNLVSKSKIKNGQKNGPELSYYLNGMIKDSINYTNGLKNGYTYGYDSSGNLIIREFYYHNLLMGPHYRYNSSNIVEYAYTDFNKNSILFTKYDSTGKCVHYGYMAETILGEIFDYERVQGLSIFIYFPKPPKFKCIYSLGLKNYKNKTKNVIELNSDREFMDTILPYPEKDWYYFVSTQIENIKDSINKVYIDEFRVRDN